MSATTPITLRVSPQDFIEISGVKKFSDGSGYTSRLAVGSWPFACSDHHFDFDNLPRFTKDITKAYERVRGKARLGHTYEKDFVEIEVHGDGHVAVGGSLIQHGPPSQELRFSFACDQTFLPELLRSLGQVAKELDGKT
jgi:hypothetical protein